MHRDPNHDIAITLRVTAGIVRYFGLHTGTQFADPTTGRLSIAASTYRAVTGSTPDAFTTDENASLALIQANATVMAAIRFLSACIDTDLPVDADTGTALHIEHIERWAAEAATGHTTPPSESEVIGRIIRAASASDALAGLIPAPRTAPGTAA
jgi:hypothetical protein